MKKQLIFYFLSIFVFLVLGFVTSYIVINYEMSIQLVFIILNLPHVGQLAFNLIAFKQYELVNFKAKYIYWAAIITLSVVLVSTLIDIPNISIIKTSAISKIAMCLIVFIITPLQAANEEFAFRIIPSIYLKKFTAPVMSTIFALMHIGNPEGIGENQLVFFLYFFLFSYLSFALCLKLNNFAPAIVMHSIVNIFAFAFVSYRGIVRQTDSFFVTSTEASAVAAIIQLLSIFLLLFLVIWRNEKKIK